jgi:hypothetical protein
LSCNGNVARAHSFSLSLSLSFYLSLSLFLLQFLLGLGVLSSSSDADQDAVVELAFKMFDIEGSGRVRVAALPAPRRVPSCRPP